MGRISIIVPFKDSAEWLERCFDSLTRLKGDFEFLVVDDHSTDNSKALAEFYAKRDDRFKVFTNEHANGVSGARNTGLDHVTGEWITYLDADDYLADDAEEAFAKAISVNANMHQLNHMRYYPTMERYAVKFKNIDGWYDIEHLPRMWCMVWNTLYRTETFGHIRFKEGLQFGEDELYNLECYAVDGIIHNADVVATVHCFNNPHSLCKRKTEKELFDQARALEEFLARQSDPALRRAVCLLMADHWQSDIYLDIFTAPKDYIN